MTKSEIKSPAGGLNYCPTLFNFIIQQLIRMKYMMLESDIFC